MITLPYKGGAEDTVIADTRAFTNLVKLATSYELTQLDIFCSKLGAFTFSEVCSDNQGYW